MEWVEDHVEETLTVYRLPREHRLRMKSTNMLERYNEELRPADYTHLPLDFYLSGRNSVIVIDVASQTPHRPPDDDMQTSSCPSCV